MFRIEQKEQKRITLPPVIFYLAPYIYELKTEFKGAKYIYVEPYIETGNFEKFMDNNKTCKDNIIGSFSHYTYSKTG